MLELVLPPRSALTEHQSPLNHEKALSFLIDRLYNEVETPRYYVSTAYIRLLLAMVDDIVCEPPQE